MKKMGRKEILKNLASLAKSQGLYGRLYEKLTDGSEESEAYLADLESQGFRDTVDMVMYIEC